VLSRLPTPSRCEVAHRYVDTDHAIVADVLFEEATRQRPL
jgi:hypothetical protein